MPGALVGANGATAKKKTEIDRITRTKDAQTVVLVMGLLTAVIGASLAEDIRCGAYL